MIPDYDVLHLSFPAEFTPLVVGERADYLATLASEPPHRRRLRLLVGLGDSIHDASAGEALHVFLSSPSGAVAPEVLGALREAGFHERAQMLAEAMALFGPNYPADNRLRSDYFAHSFLRIAESVIPDLTKPLTETERQLKALGPRFGDKTSYIRQVEDHVRGDPKLAEELARLRAELPDDARLDHLWSRILPGPSGFGEADEILRQLDRMPKPHRVVFVLTLLKGELFNGGMHQFFSNSSGAFAVQAAAYLRELGQEASAVTLDKALAMFPSDYPVSTQARRARHFAHDSNEWDTRLDALTDGVDMGALQDALIGYARREDILPR